jgi:dienelactone hydrolase
MSGARRTAALLAAALLLAVPATAEAGFGLFKAKESKTSFVSGGVTVPVWQFTPTEGQGPFPGVVMLYGLEGIDDLATVQLLYKLVAGKVSEKGYIVHFPLYFERSKIPAKEAAALKTLLRDELLSHKSDKIDPKIEQYYRDWLATVGAAVGHLRAQPNVWKERVGLVGFSMGGFLATSAAVEYPELRLAAVVNAFGGLPDPQHLHVRKTKLRLPPLLVFGGEEDDIVPDKFGRELLTLCRETGNSCEAHFYANTGHMFFDKQRGGVNKDLALNEALPTAARFLSRNLQEVRSRRR